MPHPLTDRDRLLIEEVRERLEREDDPHFSRWVISRLVRIIDALTERRENSTP